MAEETILETLFPVIPENLDPMLYEYLLELERNLRTALRGSEYMNKVILDGTIGN